MFRWRFTHTHIHNTHLKAHVHTHSEGRQQNKTKHPQQTNHTRKTNKILTNRDGGSEDFFNGTSQSSGHGALSHLSGDVVDGIEGKVTVVKDILDLLAVARGFFEGLDDEGGGRRNNLVQLK